MKRRYLFGLLCALGVIIVPGPARADGPAAIVFGGHVIPTGHGDAMSQQEYDYEQSLHLSMPELNRGIIAYNNGDYAGAIAEYDKAIAYGNWGDLVHPYNYGYNYNYLAYSNRGLAERALGKVKRSLGDQKAAQDYDKKAVADFTESITYQTTYAFAFNQLGEMRREAGDLGGARNQFNFAVTYDPWSTDFLFNLANTEQRANDFTDAAFHYGRIAELTPLNAQAWFYAGVARQAMKDTDAAITDYKKSIALAPGAANYARFYLALTLRRFYRDEKPAGLAAAVPRWPEGWPKTVGRFLLGEISENDFLAAALQSAGIDAGAQLCSADYFAGMTHLLKGDSAAARFYFTHALATKAVNLNEYDLARGELERLTGKFPPLN